MDGNDVKAKQPEEFRLPAGMASWLGPLLIAASAAAMLAWTWRAWPDLIVDFGRVIYTPWILTRGKVLYRDIVHFHGPLSPYFNALWFRLFGPSFLTVVWVNVAVLAGNIALLYKALSAVADRFAAAAGGLVFVGVFAFGQYVPIGNYNHITPYTHGITHGLLLSGLSLMCFMAYLKNPRLLLALLGGLSVGLTFLTKVEIFVACFASVGAGIALSIWRREIIEDGRAMHLAGFAAAAVAPPLAAAALLGTAMPIGEVFGGIFLPWRLVLGGTVGASPFYLRGFGLLDPARNMTSILTWAGGAAVVFLPAFGLAMILRKPGRSRTTIAAAVFAGTAGILLALDVDWILAPRAISLIVLAAIAVSAWALIAGRRDPACAAKMIPRLVLLIFAFAMMGKMILNFRLYHYGFVLALPGTMAFVAVTLCWIPVWIDRRGGSGNVFRAAALAVLLVAGEAYLQDGMTWRRTKTFSVGEGANLILAGREGRVVRRVLAEIEKRAAPGRTLAVLPEGSFLNFLARRMNPTPYVNITPFEMAAYSEEKILDAYRQSPPDYVALIDRGGPVRFGEDYGRKVLGWLIENYRILTRIGKLGDGPYSFILMERKG